MKIERQDSTVPSQSGGLRASGGALSISADLGPAQTISGVGHAQGLDIRGEDLFVYGDAHLGVIRAFRVKGTELVPAQRKPLYLTTGGREIASHPTGLTEHPAYGTFLGDTVGGKGKILHLDWPKALGTGTLDGAVLNTIVDDLAVNGTRPEFVTMGGRPLIATSDYGPSGNEIRLYDPKKLVCADRTSDPGVLVGRVPCGPWVQSLYWIEDLGLLVLAQNRTAGRGWRLTFVDLEASLSVGRAVVANELIFDPADELEGFQLLPERSSGSEGGMELTGVAVSSSLRGNARMLRIRVAPR